MSDKPKKTKISEFKRASILFEASKDRLKVAIENEDYDTVDREKEYMDLYLKTMFRYSFRPIARLIFLGILSFILFFGLLVWCAVFK